MAASSGPCRNSLPMCRSRYRGEGLEPGRRSGRDILGDWFVSFGNPRRLEQTAARPPRASHRSFGCLVAIGGRLSIHNPAPVPGDGNRGGRVGEWPGLLDIHQCARGELDRCIFHSVHRHGRVGDAVGGARRGPTDTPAVRRAAGRLRGRNDTNVLCGRAVSSKLGEIHHLVSDLQFSSNDHRRLASGRSVLWLEVGACRWC